MSYFSNNKLYHYYEVTDSNIGSDYITKDTIEVLNNEKIRFDLSKLSVLAPIHGVLNSTDVETIKITIDWGDGNIDRLSKPLVSAKSSIGTYRPNQWKVIDHLFNVEKKYEYETDDTQYLHKIVITAYNTFNDKFVIQIPYKILYKTIYDLGSEFSLFSANTTNTNKVSYTVKLKATDSMFVINTLDWRTIYGDDDTVIVKESVHLDFSDEFVNEDFMVWDWKTPPKITLTCKADEFKNLITCSFEEKTVEVEEWHPQIRLVDDRSNIVYDAVKSSDKAQTFSTSVENGISGVFKIYVSPLIGINGVSTSSESSYLLYNTNVYPKNLCVSSNNNKIINVTIDKNKYKNQIDFNYTIPKPHLLVSLTKAEFILDAFLEDGTKVDDVSITYDLLNSLFDSNGNPLYIKTSASENVPVFTHTVKMRNIPNKLNVNVVKRDENGALTEVVEEKEIYYKARINTNDVIGEEDNVYFYDTKNTPFKSDENYIPLNATNVNNCEINFLNYTIGNFTSGGVVVGDIDPITKKMNITWSFNNHDEWDTFNVKITDGSNKDEGILLNENHTHIGGDEFEGLSKKDGAKTYTKTIDTNFYDAEKFYVTVTYLVNMNDIYGVREVQSSKTVTFNYPTPNIIIYDIQPNISISYNTLNGEQSLKFNSEVRGESEELLKNITIEAKDTSGKVVTDTVSNLEWTYKNIPYNNKDITYNFVFNAANANDVFNRKGSSSNATLKINAGANDLLKLPRGGIDYLDGNSGSQFSNLNAIPNEDGEYPIVDWRWVKENTLHDIDKFYKITKNGKEYFGGKKCNLFAFNDVKRYVLYEIITLQRDDEKIRRFKPVILNNSISISNSDLVELQNINDCVTHSSISSYSSGTDTGNLLIQWNKLDYQKTKNMWLNLIKGDDILYTVDIKGINTYTFSNLAFGTDYKYSIELNSEYVKTEKNSLTSGNVSILINPEEAIVHSGNPIINQITEEKSYVTWNWELYHTSCDDVYFYYKDLTGKTEKFHHVKLQSRFQPSMFDNKTSDNKRNVITYGFKMKSSSLNKKGYTADSDGYITIHQKTIKL